MPRKHHFTSASFYSACLGSAIRTLDTHKSLYLLWGIYGTARNGRECYLISWDHFTAPIPRNHLGNCEPLCGPFCRKKFHLSQTFQVMLSFSASSRMQLHFPHSWVTAENWGPWSVLLGKEEVRSEESWEIFLWRSLQRLRCFPEVQDKLTEVTGNVQQWKKINPFISSWSCCVSLLERCWPCLFLYSRQWARGLMQSSVRIDRDLWCDQYP